MRPGLIRVSFMFLIFQFLFLFSAPVCVNAAGEIYSIQTGSFSKIENAQRQFDSLKRNVDEQRVDILRIEKIGRYYKVRLGIFTAYSEAKEFLQAINHSYPEAFTTSKTLSGEIVIEKTNYKTETIPITIEIKMSEIFPGMPTFYFILLVVSIIGILGSIVAYRVIQQARIPKHVKRIRKVKGIIKSKRKITEIISVTSKAEMIAKLFGDEWKQIDLSIEKTLGIGELKKKLPIRDKIPKKKGDIE